MIFEQSPLVRHRIDRLPAGTSLSITYFGILYPPLNSQASEQIDLRLNNPSASQRLAIPALCSDSLALVC